MHIQDVVNVSKDAFDVFCCKYGSPSHRRVLKGLLEHLQCAQGKIIISEPSMPVQTTLLLSIEI